MKQLVLFGDSLLAQFDKEQVLGLEALLPEYNVHNCATGGFDTNDSLQRSAFIAGLKPDIVVVSLGTNDAAPWKQVTLDTYETNLQKIVQAFAGSKIILYVPPPVNEQKESIEPKRLNSTLKQYAEAAQKVADQTGAAVIRSWEIFAPLLENGNDYHVDDGVHFNDYGNGILISNIAKVVKLLR